jgi:hypothetical protein
LILGRLHFHVTYKLLKRNPLGGCGNLSYFLKRVSYLSVYIDTGHDVMERLY